MPQVEKIAPAKRGGALLVHLSDQSLVRLSAEAVLELGLKVGDELDAAALERVSAVALTERVRKSALGMISVVALSTAELCRRLERKGYPQAEAEAAVKWLESMGVLDDRAYAEGLAAKYAAAGVSRRACAQKMREKGVERELIDGALESYPEPDAALDRLVQKALRGRTPDRETQQKLVASLARKGFCYEDIRAALRRVGQEPEEQ